MGEKVARVFGRDFGVRRMGVVFSGVGFGSRGSDYGVGWENFCRSGVEFVFFILGRWGFRKSLRFVGNSG